jgi:hypothetical protein
MLKTSENKFPVRDLKASLENTVRPIVVGFNAYFNIMIQFYLNTMHYAIDNIAYETTLYIAKIPPNNDYYCVAEQKKAVH